VGVDALLERGVRVRGLCQHTARFNQRTVDQVKWVVRRGARVRTVSDDFMRMLVFDRRAAVIGLRDGAVLIRDTTVVEFMYTTLERMWERGVDFGPEYDHDVVEETTEQIKETIVNLLVDGVEDKVIARRVGVSLRTCQRHISEIMRRLGARNRLHAGYLLHRRELEQRNAAAR
jgi:DNA-binding CsgD family transcriptional regulator